MLLYTGYSSSVCTVWSTQGREKGASAEHSGTLITFGFTSTSVSMKKTSNEEQSLQF